MLRLAAALSCALLAGCSAASEPRSDAPVRANLLEPSRAGERDCRNYAEQTVLSERANYEDEEAGFAREMTRRTREDDVYRAALERCRAGRIN